MNSINKQLSDKVNASVSKIPDQLQGNITAIWNFILGNFGQEKQLPDVQQIDNFTKILACSEFVQKQVIIHTDTANRILYTSQSNDIEKLIFPVFFKEDLAQQISLISVEAEIMKILRRARNQQLMLLASADILGAGVETVIGKLSDIADCFIQLAAQWAYDLLLERYGAPIDSEGNEQKLIVIAMGKLGAHELNFSSDIDLVFCYPSAGETNGKKVISNEEFFLKTCRIFIRLLDQQTPDGFVFRVDARLRPYGSSGALVLNFDAMELYYQSSAREWERYAMIKARLVTGEAEDKTYLMSMLKSFVYRRYIDYGVFDAIRIMKRQIDEQLRKKDKEDSVKLGPGGIREIEFIGQAFQLVRGGRDQDLQQRSIIPLLGLLAEKGHIQQQTRDDLVRCYLYLRRLENAIQQIADQQTHDLPKDTLKQTRLVVAMNVESWQFLVDQAKSVMTLVHGYFNELVAATAPKLSTEVAEIDCLCVEMPALLALLNNKNIAQPEGAAKSLYDFCQTYNVRQVQEKGRKYLSCLLMLLINNEVLGKQSNKVFESLLQVIEKICNRTVYLVLLVENEAVLEQLIRLAIASPWVVSQISRTPILLDELIDPERLYSSPTRENLQFELDQIIECIDVDDDEGRMDALRVFKHVNVLRVAAADLTKAIPLMIVSDKLSEIAEVIINKAVALSWHTISQKHGAPDGADADQVSDFSVIGFGKLGGIELGFGSDLDLVFLHKEIADDECTYGENSIPLSDFYSRLVRRIILLLTTRTMSGPLYEIDLRLRPNGNSGLLISSVSSFEKYQLNQAWTWEQQALIRARPVAGGKEIAIRFNQIRCAVLSQNREWDKLRQDIVDMRQKMRDSLFKEKVGYFDLKQGHGGIVDIEFIVQFGVLAHAFENPVLLVYTDNMRLLQKLEQIGFLTLQQCQQLTLAYQCYREASHHAVLAELRPIIEGAAFEETAESVKTIWNQIFNKK